MFKSEHCCILALTPLHMLSFGNTQLKKLIIHRVGNKLLEDGVTLSHDAINLEGKDDLANVLKTYFLSQFREPAFHNFFKPKPPEENDVLGIVNDLFESTKGFVKKSKDIANLLYDFSNHPKIKSGELYVTYFEEILVNNELADAIGIFKSENKDTFLKIYEREESLNVKSEEGISIKKLDKGCLVLNLDADKGFRVCVVDNQNSNNEAQYWKNDFLKLKPVSDNYHQTQNYLSLAKDFVTERLDEEFEVSKADQIDYLNRSIDYFKKNEQFNEQDFASSVFEHASVINSFKKFKDDFQDQNDMNIVSEFEISNPAVKRQSKVFKSVLKLDKNFHIYIHGNRDLIERGVEEDGRKFYKIYYREES